MKIKEKEKEEEEIQLQQEEQEKEQRNSLNLISSSSFSNSIYDIETTSLLSKQLLQHKQHQQQEEREEREERELEEEEEKQHNKNNLKLGRRKRSLFSYYNFFCDSLRCPMEPNISFSSSFFERTSWLTGLLIFQSCSSFILEANINLMESHPAIIYFLTMLVGAGGNAGNQAAVRIIRGIALGTVNEHNRQRVFLRELFMALSICIAICGIGFVRCLLFSHNSLQETAAIIASLAVIVFVSIVFGAILPFLLLYIGFDPAHASTTIQVVMDILGVLITCLISSILLQTLVSAPIK